MQKLLADIVLGIQVDVVSAALKDRMQMTEFARVSFVDLNKPTANAFSPRFADAPSPLVKTNTNSTIIK